MLSTIYDAFNTGDLDTVLAEMTDDVQWARAFKGGFVEGQTAVKEYWIEQGKDISAHNEPLSYCRDDEARICVEVHQVVRDTKGDVVAEANVGHRMTMSDGKIQKFEVLDLPFA